MSSEELETLRSENADLKQQLSHYIQMEKDWEETERKLLGKLKRTKANLDSRTQMLEEANRRIEELKKLVPKHARKPSGPEIPIQSAMLAQEMDALQGSDEEDEDEMTGGSGSLSTSAKPAFEAMDSLGAGLIDREPKIMSTKKGRIKRASMASLEGKVVQRSTIEETIGRGILYHRPDSRTEHSVVEQSKLLAKRRASAQVGKALESRVSVQELRSKGIYKETQDLMEDTKRKRRVSRVLEATLNPRARATMEDLTQSGITLASLFSEGTGVESADLEALGTGGAGRSGRRARGSGELTIPEEDAKTRDDGSGDMMSSSSSSAAAASAAGAGAGDSEEKVVEAQQWTGVTFAKPLSFAEKRQRVDIFYGERHSVKDLIFRGILKGHPSLRSRMNRIRKNKERRENKLVIDFLYRRRPRDNETMMKRLVDMRILPKESLKAREIHKRRLSRQLEASLISRPTPQEINDDMGYQVIDLGPLLLSFLVGSAMVEAQNAMAGAGGGPGGGPMPRALEGPPGSGPGQMGSAAAVAGGLDAYSSSRAADLAGGGGVGMAMAGALMNAAAAQQQAGVGGTGRRGSADSDVSDLDANRDAEALKRLQQEVADKEAELRSQQKLIEQLRIRERDHLSRIESMEHKYQASLKEVSERSAEVDGSSRQTVDVAIDELHRTQMDLQQARVYIDVLRKRMEARGVRMETEDDLKSEIKERLAAFIPARPTIDELMARNILPTKQSEATKQRASAVVSSHLDSMKSAGIKERTYLETVPDDAAVAPSSASAADGGASAADLDAMSGIIDDLQGQVKLLKGEKDELLNELDELRQSRSADASAVSSGLSASMDEFRSWFLERPWMASSKKFVEREKDSILEMSDEKSVLENLKAVIKTYMGEVSEMISGAESRSAGLEQMLSQKESLLSQMAEELAEAQAKVIQAEEDVEASHTTPGGPTAAESEAVDPSEFNRLKEEVEELKAETMRAAQDKMTMMAVMSKEMEALRSQLRQMGRMQRSLVAMGRVQDA